MAGEIERPNWGDGTHSQALVPAADIDPDSLPAPADLLAEMQGSEVVEHNSPDEAAVTAFSEGEKEVLETMGTNLPGWLNGALGELDADLKQAVGRLALYHRHLEPERFFKRLQDKLTLDQKIRLDDWIDAHVPDPGEGRGMA